MGKWKRDRKDNRFEKAKGHLANISARYEWEKTLSYIRGHYEPGQVFTLKELREAGVVKACNELTRLQEKRNERLQCNAEKPWVFEGKI